MCSFTKFLIEKGSTKYEYPIDVLEKTYLVNVWMISQCRIEERNDTLKQLCESPGIWGNFESVMPISDSVINYRNKFCAYCNGIDESTPLISWYIELYCDADLSSAKYILSDIIRRKCNLFFRPPENIPVEECAKLSRMVTDEITNKTCKLTFQKSFNSIQFFDRETCERDPEPKHYLCFACDEGHPWNKTGNMCFSDKGSIVPPVSPPFSAILDIDAISLAEIHKNPNEFCDTALQFYDNKLVGAFISGHFRQYNLGKHEQYQSNPGAIQRYADTYIRGLPKSFSGTWPKALCIYVSVGINLMIVEKTFLS